jgi:hypothetical protein
MLGDQLEGQLRELHSDPRWSIAPRPDAEALIRAAAKRQRLRAASVTTAVAAVVAAAIIAPLSLLPGSPASGGQHQSSVRPSAGSKTAHAPIVIDPQIGETFARAPASATPTLTAQQAWARFAHVNHWGGTSVPAGVHVQLGLLTLPVGPADAPGTGNLPKSNGKAYTADNELTYGYSSPSGCPTLNPRLEAPPGAHCISWVFLNANTGKQIDSTYQKVGHWHWRLVPNKI